MKLLIALMILVCVGLVGTAAADDYEVSLTVSYPSNLNDLGNSTWLPFGTYVIEKGETEHVMDGSIELIDVSVQTNTALVEVMRGGERYPNVMKTGESVIVDETFKITLNELRKIVVGDGVITGDDTVVSIWIEPNSLEKLGLEEGSVNAYNPIEYGKTAGWSTTGNTELVVLSIEKREDFGGILVLIDGGEWEEVTTGASDRRIFELNDNAEYIVDIHYEKVDFWGGETEEQEVYTLKISGLESTGSVAVSSGLLGSYSKEEGSIIKLVTAVDGEFEEFSGATVTSEGQNNDGNYVWNVVFDNAGTKRLTFVSESGGEGYFDFSISSNQESADTSEVSSKDDDGDNSLGYIVFGILLLGGIVALVVFKKKEKPKNSETVTNSFTA